MLQVTTHFTQNLLREDSQRGIGPQGWGLLLIERVRRTPLISAHLCRVLKEAWEQGQMQISRTTF